MIACLHDANKLGYEGEKSKRAVKKFVVGGMVNNSQIPLEKKGNRTQGREQDHQSKGK